ncbi:MAG: YbaB/EbfC family nucleoid-associated protein [candidate division KSB1 bacterium]|nr:YbaB/EbfC family nucleoid-associated protein [candidate division KSB1 bacterium]
MKGGIGGLLKQAQKMQQEIERIQKELADMRIEGTAGGGMVKAVASGAQELLEIKIDPEVVDPNDVEMLEDLVLAAVNQALENAKAKAESEMARATGGLMPNLGGIKIPGL